MQSVLTTRQSRLEASVRNSVPGGQFGFGLDGLLFIDPFVYPFPSSVAFASASTLLTW